MSPFFLLRVFSITVVEFPRSWIKKSNVPKTINARNEQAKKNNIAIINCCPLSILFWLLSRISDFFCKTTCLRATYRHLLRHLHFPQSLLSQFIYNEIVLVDSNSFCIYCTEKSTSLCFKKQNTVLLHNSSQTYVHIYSRLVVNHTRINIVKTILYVSVLLFDWDI